MRNIDLRSAYGSIYENRGEEQLDEIIAPVAGALGKAALGAAAASPAVAGGIGGTIGAATGGKKKVKKAIGTGSGAAVGGAIGGPIGAVAGGLLGNKVAEEVEQLDELAPVIAGAAGKLAALGAKKAAVGGAAKAAGGKGLMAKAGRAAQSKYGQKAIEKGTQKIGDSVTNRLSNNEETQHEDTDMTQESYTAQYMEGYKKLPFNKMQDKAAMKPDTARGESQARKMDTVRKATKKFPNEVKDMVKGVSHSNKVRGLEKRYNAPSADNAAEKSRKNKAYKLEGQRRKDLDKRYGPKKEECIAHLLDIGIATNEKSATNILEHMSDAWFDHLFTSEES